MTKLRTGGRWELYGDTDPEVLICGHSHAYAYMRGAQHPPDSARFRRAVAYSSPVTAGAPSGDDYWEFVAGHDSTEVFALVWNGNQHNVDFLFEHSPPLHVLRPSMGQDEAPADAVWIPRSMIRAHFKPTIDELTRVLRRLSPVGNVVVMGTPPPKSSSHVRSHLSSEAHFAAVLAASPPDQQPVVAREQLRVALWEIIQQMLRECAADAGVDYLPTPPSVMDADGLLEPKFSAADSTHANFEYGDELWSEIERFMTSREAA